MSDQQQGDILLHLGRLEGKVDALLHSRDRHQAAIDVLESKVDVLRLSRARLMGMAAAVGAIGGVIGTALELTLRGH